MPCAVVLGAPPCITFASMQKLPETSTRCTSPAGSSARRSTWCKAKTVDLLVPAEAEIVIEGYIDTE